MPGYPVLPSLRYYLKFVANFQIRKALSLTMGKSGPRDQRLALNSTRLTCVDFSHRCPYDFKFHTRPHFAPFGRCKPKVTAQRSTNQQRRKYAH
jgi:hypothetical protein